jgi:hypothetical protein
MKPKDNLGITGDQEHKTLLITGQSTTQQATAFHPQILTSPSDPEYTKLLTTKATVTKYFVDKILMTPKFQQIAVKQNIIAA